MSTQDVWKEFWDEDSLTSIITELKKTSTLCDRQCFGIVREEHTEQIKASLIQVKGKIDKMIRRLP